MNTVSIHAPLQIRVHYLLYSGCRHQGRCTNTQSVTRVLHVTNLGSSFENFLEINSSKTLLCTCMFVKDGAEGA